MRDRFALAVALSCVLALAGCGDDEAGTGAPKSEWSAPGAGETSEADVLTAFASSMDAGQALDLEAWTHDAQRVAETLWPPEGDTVDVAAKNHLEIALIVGEVVRWLGESDDARAEREKSNPVDLEIHDAFAAAIAKGPEPYRAWCANEGGALLDKLREERRRRFFPDGG